MRVALCQMNAGDEPEANRKAAGELLEEAADGGADLAGLPELFTYLGPSSRHRAVAEPIPGPTSAWLQETARRRGVWILGGSFLEADLDRIYNTSLLIDRRGDVVARYRKIHRFDVDLPGQPAIRESATTSAGEDVVSADTEFGVAGMSICYDLRFPELYRRLKASDLIVVPAAFTATTGQAHWEALLRARAIENLCYVLASAQGGRHDNGRATFGHSMLVDPWGEVLAVRPNGAGIVLGTVEPARIAACRASLPALAHRVLQ